MSIDYLSDYLDDVRAGISLVVSPIISIADYPNRSIVFLDQILSSRIDLRARVTQMENELLVLHSKTLTTAALIAENERLRTLLGSSAKLQDKVLVAELVGIDPDPHRHEITIDKGSNHNVFVGQPVLDAGGLVGQVVEVGPAISRVLLIIDQSHSIPVQIVRNNLRFIAEGYGISRRLKLLHVPNTADIKKGDLLVSSGLGNRFPAGYPVGIVSRMEDSKAQPFAIAEALPSAKLDRSRHVLLIFSGQKPRAVPPGEKGHDG